MSQGLEKNPTILEVKDLVVRYRSKDVICGTSLHVKSGEVTVLIGSNGSGKSTLLKAVAGIIRPESGVILFKGTEIQDRYPHEISRLGISILMQGGAIFPSLTVIEHFQLALQNLNEVVLEERAEIVWRIFPKLHTLRKSRAGLLSGGQRQLLALSMILIQKSRLWLLDEPSAGLAPQAAQDLVEIIQRVNEQQGISLLIAEQNLKFALQLAHRLYVLKHGLAHSEERLADIENGLNLKSILFA